MPASARRHIVQEAFVGVYHCIARCVRRAFLCGIDSYSGRDYSHRKAWILDRLRHLAGLFGVEVCGYAIMSNHLHLVLRNRPDSVEQWSDAEVALRCASSFRSVTMLRASRRSPTTTIWQCSWPTLTGWRVLRGRLSSLSWFMRCLCEWVARAANHEEGTFGRFWAGRFKSQPLLDEAALLACSVYVDLNPIRAGIASTPEESQFTSGFERILSLVGTPGELDSSREENSAETFDRPNEWLCELTLRETDVVPTNRAAEELTGCTVRNGSAARADRERPCRCCGASGTYWLFCRDIDRAARGGVKTAAPCAGVGSRVSADRDQKVRYAARLDGPGTAAGQAWGDPRRPGSDPGPAGCGSIELGGHGARLRSHVQASGRSSELACDALHRVAHGAGFRARRRRESRFCK